MITGITPKRAKKETLSDALAPLANAITKAFTGNPSILHPRKTCSSFSTKLSVEFHQLKWQMFI